jgi:tRNA modification GTPase
MNYAKHNLQDTIAAIATPPGVGAIGIIRLSGGEALAIAQQVFGGKDLTLQPGHTLHFGTIVADDGAILDEVLVSVFRAPHSYTGENIAEISCHGSPYILRSVLELLVRKGARLAQPGEFTLRAFLNGKMDLSQAEAVADLIASSSESAHKLAMRQMRGGFSHAIKRLREELINFASLLELELDFSEEDVEFANRRQLEELVRNIRELVAAMLHSFQLGNVIKHGVPTVIAGRPNAGKSTLLNALLQEERAIVSPVAGTTRDTIEEVLNIEGVEFRLIDTAGIREAQDQIEAIGVEKALEKVRQAALLLYVFDVAETSPEAALSDLSRLRQGDMQVLVLCNKMDTNPYFRPEWLCTGGEVELEPRQVVTLSALHGMNIPYLREKIYEAAIAGQLDLESPVVTSVRHYEALLKAADSLDEVLRGLSAGLSSDFVAMDLRQALNHLGEILGEVSTDDLLETIFSKFCIGK